MPNSAFELMLEGNLTDADRQRMLAQQLRNRRQTGELALLSGDKVLAPLGEGLFNEALDKEGVSLNIKGNEVAAAEDTRRFGLEEAMGRRRQTEVERHNRAMEEKQDRESLRLAASTTNQFNNNVRRLSESMTRAKIPELMASIGQVDSEMSKYGDGNLPGVGGVANFLPGFTKDARVMKSKIADIRNIILQARSGAAVTPSEAERLLEEFSLNGFNSDEEFLAAWADLKATIGSGIENIRAGYDDDVLSTYDARRSATSTPDQRVTPSSKDGSSSVSVSWSELK